MNTILLAVTAIALVVLVALLLRPVQKGSEARVEEDERISPLLRGINYLLSDEPDRALQEMVQVARLRSEAAEVYMALGEMFRSKGEIGRAVRIHQNLLARLICRDRCICRRIWRWLQISRPVACWIGRFTSIRKRWICSRITKAPWKPA